MFKLPSAWICGVRVKALNSTKCVTVVSQSWINQNPFNSLYFAVQAMAAELSTGALVMNSVQNSEKKISMLVAQTKAVFSKKAVGKIKFTCVDGDIISSAIQNTLASGEGQTFWMTSVGISEIGEEVSVFKFKWTIKVKNYDNSNIKV